MAGYIDDFHPKNYMEKKEIGRYDLFTQYAYIAAVQVLEQAKQDLDNVDKDRIGIYIGSGIGGLNTLLANYQTMLDKGPKRVSPFK